MSTRSTSAFVVAIFCLALHISPANGQYQTIIEERVSVARALTGRVDVDRASAVGVRVELRTSDWQTVLASPTTDANGNFHLDSPKTQVLLYLRLSAPGLNPYELRVKIRKSGAPELRLHMQVAT